MTSRFTRLAAVAATAAVAGMTVTPAFAAEAGTCSGSISWPISPSFISYSTKMGNKLEVTDGAKLEGKNITFDIDGAKTKAASKDGKVTIVTKGKVHSTGHEGKMDTTLTDISFTIDKDGKTGEIATNFRAREFKDFNASAPMGDWINGNGVKVANMALSPAADLSGKDVAANGTTTFDKNTDSVKIFPTYDAGRELGAVSIEAKGCGLAKETESTPAPSKPVVPPVTPKDPGKEQPGKDNGSSAGGGVGIVAIIALVGAALAGLFQWAVSQGLVPAPR
ncbi:HtaA domain-containing protein [Corynebacterium aquilae]|uniref:Htaa domain-containing protein n=1 Tax=Corynebacterium aquilae DSM 44791 TaxID=1431546 RepID=A0A1L7CE77_9CORY|nr:HtaA domain-containing protein [Corynebacterium aquilae]APT84124.1 hypothetical protein CAQU_02495 [Corynebacterium aquilae DSM 44791]